MGKGDATRQAVVDRAVEIAGRLGIAGLTIGSLATATEMSKSGLFAHFRSKEALQLAVLARARESFVDEVVRPALATTRGVPRVRALFEHWLATSQASAAGCLFVSAATEFDDDPGPVRDQLVRDHRDLVDSITQMYRAGVQEGQFRDDLSPEQFAHDLYGVMLGHFHAHRLLRDPAAERRARDAFERLLAGIRTSQADGDLATAGSAATHGR
ncbi:TetR family transcriptional regulator [Cellulomonas algicola]|uniref:TetR family transcriptional regulator n=1 Tax=Cellulomonas algicola TaxID=2071633 RepID=A0A401UWF8_9CELL|nr:TetR/AcrR family transcriptional regulator [Cellulomonas algicola]GCD19016.1 TetR family transcriptional regulator [Cellulomonas algicola]